MIHPQLLQDCHLLGTLGSGSLLLHRNALMPWFILVPDTELADLLDLPQTQRDQVMRDCAGISAFIKQNLGFPKLNFAGLGNVVPQMHLHIIGRREGDACWPQPVWGNLAGESTYSATTIAEWQDQLTEKLGLCSTAS